MHNAKLVVLLSSKSLKGTSKKQEKAILIGVNSYRQVVPIEEYLDELEQLVFSSGGVTKKRFIQNLEHPNPKTYVGSGKIQEIADYCYIKKIDIAVFDDEFTHLPDAGVQATIYHKIDYYNARREDTTPLLLFRLNDEIIYGSFYPVQNAIKLLKF